jgi:hypothetical protein
VAELRQEELNLLIAKLSKLRAEDIVDANMVRISTTARFTVSNAMRLETAEEAKRTIDRLRRERGSG